jgi:hypothetical protein
MTGFAFLRTGIFLGIFLEIGIETSFAKNGGPEIRAGICSVSEGRCQF